MSTTMSRPDLDGALHSSTIADVRGIPAEISMMTDLLTGGVNKIVNSIITLRLCSPNMPDLISRVLSTRHHIVGQRTQRKLLISLS